MKHAESFEQASKSFSSVYKTLSIDPPKMHVVLGSGLSGGFTSSELPKGWTLMGQRKFSEIEGLAQSTAPGHKGVFLYLRHECSPGLLCVQAGRLHGYEGLDPTEVVAPLRAAFLAGTKKFVLTNAAGSVNPDFGPGSLMIIQDHVNFTGKNPLTGHNAKHSSGQELGPRFPDMNHAYNTELTTRLESALKKNSLTVHKGIYIGVAGPSYETPAEIKLFNRWGMGAVGMSTVWEAIALSHCKATVAAVSFISNFGAGISNQELRHEDVENEGQKVSKIFAQAILNFAQQEIAR